jgi:hypothetical protein
LHLISNIFICTTYIYTITCTQNKHHMNNKFLTATLCVALSALAVTTKAQTKYTEGVITYDVKSQMGAAESKAYFKGDSIASTSKQGPAYLRFISAKNGEYFAVLVDVPVAKIKKAGIATPAEIEEFAAMIPKFKYEPSTETKDINGFKCKKVNVSDDKGGKFEAWITNDISVPPSTLSYPLKDIGGVPIQFVSLQMGQKLDITVKTITNDKVPAGIFSIPADFTKGSLADLKP